MNWITDRVPEKDDTEYSDVFPVTLEATVEGYVTPTGLRVTGYGRYNFRTGKWKILDEEEGGWDTTPNWKVVAWMPVPAPLEELD